MPSPDARVVHRAFIQAVNRPLGRTKDVIAVEGEIMCPTVNRSSGPSLFTYSDYLEPDTDEKVQAAAYAATLAAAQTHFERKGAEAGVKRGRFHAPAPEPGAPLTPVNYYPVPEQRAPAVRKPFAGSCYTCKEWGHTSTNCPRRAAQHTSTAPAHPSVQLLPPYPGPSYTSSTQMQLPPQMQHMAALSLPYQIPMGYAPPAYSSQPQGGPPPLPPWNSSQAAAPAATFPASYSSRR